MSKKKVLLLFPGFYTLADSFAYGFEKNSYMVQQYDYRTDVSRIEQRVQGHIEKFPHAVRKKWYQIHVMNINKNHMNVFNRENPDTVVVYNSEMLLPETVETMKKRSKIIFFLGDSPFYTRQNEYYFQCIKHAEVILCPDSYWQKQLMGLGFEQARFFLIGSSPEVNYRMVPSLQDMQKWASDLVFVGVSYSSAIGYKRALFLSQFADLNFRIYTDGRIRRWLHDFPQLDPCLRHPRRRISNSELNTLLNCCKVYPVDANPGLINGVHVRILDCIASGILPIAEYRKDVQREFEKDGLPIIRRVYEAGLIAKDIVTDEKARRERLEMLLNLVNKRFSPENAVEALIQTENL